MAIVKEIAQTQIGTMTYLGPVPSLTDDESLTYLHEVISACLSAHKPQIVLDFAKVSAVSSRALELLLDLHGNAVSADGWIKVTNLHHVIQDVFIATGLIDHIRNIDTTSSEPHHSTKTITRAKRKLGDILLDKGIVNEKQIAEATRLQRETGMRIGHVLIEKGWVTEEQMLKCLSEQLNIPYIMLRPGCYDPDVARLIKRETAYRLEVLPLFKIRGVLTLATHVPQSVPNVDEIETITGCKVRPVLARREDILDYVNEVHAETNYISDYMSVLGKGTAHGRQLLPNSFTNIDSMSGDSPVINLVNSMIHRAVHEGASDIHIEPARTKTSIRLRIDGILHEAMAPPVEMHSAIVSRLKVMANLDISEKRLPQDGRIQVSIQSRGIDLRISTLPGIFGEVVVLRVLDKSQSIHEIAELGMSKENLSHFKRILKRSHGMILVTGPTGSGKTTTLYAAISHLNSVEKNIVTIEDPIEYQVDIVNQNQVNESIGLTFSRTLKHVLRQDPDIIMVGEIRDKETAEIAIHAALTGHLVLSTLHTNDSMGATIRLADMGVEPYLLSSAISGVIAQRLVRKVCNECKTFYPAPQEIRTKYGWTSRKKVELAKGEGCPTCYDSGYKGRLGIYEIIEFDSDLQKLVNTNPSHEELKAILKNKGHKTLFDDGLNHVLNGETTLEELTRVVNE